MSQTFLEIVMRHLDNSLLLLMLRKFHGGFLEIPEVFGNLGVMDIGEMILSFVWVIPHPVLNSKLS